MRTIRYTVRPGDTLWGIATSFEITVDEIVRYNNILYIDQIYPGQQLLIPTKDCTPPDIYIVRQGDTLYSIAQKYNISIPYILERNDIPDPNLIYPGQILYLVM